MRIHERTYELGSVPVVFQHPDQAAGGELRGLWEELFAARATEQRASGPHISLLFEFVDSLPAPPAGGELISRDGGVRVWSTGTGFVLHCSSATVEINGAETSGRFRVHPSFLRRPADYQRRFLLLAFVILAHGHERYGLHANAIANGPVGCVIAGRSGSGKTTLSLVLIQQGWSYLSDDAILLRDGAEGGIEALALNRGFSCTKQTASRLGFAGSDGSQAEKSLQRLSDDFGGGAIDCCRPTLVLLPSIVANDHSELVPIRQQDALGDLIQFSAGIMVSRDEAPRQMRVLTRLTSQSRSFRFLAGRDVFDNPSSVAQLLRSAARE